MFNKKRLYNSIGYGVAGGVGVMATVTITAPLGYDTVSVGTGFLFGAIAMAAMELYIRMHPITVTGGE